ncbi:MAG: AbrB/MazE/SpoVT family DNA-binding domain-containing protein [Deltaproteobacteria bacterium]|nr:AbrB/MazE/SpoVT family DNA-binding domain-containing protein [Deltaproteobacteria bacterium]
MSETVLISERGQVTLPASVRKKYALDKNTPLILEETREGILLRKASLIPIHHYSENEIQGWLKEDQVLPRDKKWLK